MAMAMPLTVIRNKLKTLCAFGDGWSYAIFWRFHLRNPLLLTVEEAYYEEQLGEEIANNMLPQVHLLGEGIVGEAAFTGKHSWVHSDSHTHQWNMSGHNSCENDSGLYQQFSSGIKTIVVIPVKALGVVQFGSKKKILERMDFLEKTQSLLMEIDDMTMTNVSENAVLSMDFENYDLNGLLASISSENSCDWNLKFAHDENSKELTEFYSSASHNNPFSSQFKTCEEGMTSLEVDSSSLGDQLKDTIEAHLNPNSSMNRLIANNLCFGEWSGEVSSFDLLGQQLVSEIWEQEVADVLPAAENAFASNKVLVQDKLQNSLDDQHSSQSVVVTDVNFPTGSNTLHGLSKSLEPVDMSEEFLKFTAMDDLCQWFSPSPEDSMCRTTIQLDNTLAESIEFNPTCSDLSDIPVTCLAGNNAISTTGNSDGKETSVVMHSSENDLLDSMEFDFGCDQSGEWWGNILAQVGSAATDTDFSECISTELNTGTNTMTGNRKRLFSELGIEELLRGETNYNPFNSSNFENELTSSNKRKMVEFSPMNRTPVHFANLAGAEPRANLMQPVSDLDKTNSLLGKKDTFPKLQVGMLINDSHSINIKRVPQKPEEPTKATKKRARPGESSRPRPKDRQQIQDCLKELRGIIPNGGKCSIDSLLDRTIRYLIFLRSVVKYADILQEPNEPKLIEQENGVVLKDTSMGDSKNLGATWAFEVVNQTMVCPIIVEDRSPPGQMLIEMLCEEQGFFLEIVDIIRGFGLNILKGKMEKRKNKLWARFIVEANRHVTRIDVFWSLIHLLQQTNTSGIDAANKNCNVIDANIC